MTWRLNFTYLVCLVSVYAHYLHKYTNIYCIQINFKIILSSDLVHLLLIVTDYLSLFPVIANHSIISPQLDAEILICENK